MKESINAEIWEKINGYSNYMVSNLGRVKTIDYNHTKQERLLTIFNNMHGYPSCNLMEYGIRKRMLVHRLVCDAFIPNIETKETVNHKNGIKTDNRVENLEYVTAKENLQHAHKTGLVKYCHGEKHRFTKYNDETILKIKNYLKQGLKSGQISKLMGINIKYISGINCNYSRKYIKVC